MHCWCSKKFSQCQSVNTVVPSWTVVPATERRAVHLETEGLFRGEPGLDMGEWVELNLLIRLGVQKRHPCRQSGVMTPLATINKTILKQ